MFTWIPDHIGIHENTVVDQAAKNALNDPVSNRSIPYTDFKTFIMKYILKRWQDTWDKHNTFLNWQDSLFLRSKSEGTRSLYQMSYRT